MSDKKLTLSLIKADVGGYPGHSGMHENLIRIADDVLSGGLNQGILLDYRVLHVGDDLQLVILHGNGMNYEPIHKLAWDAFKQAADEAKVLGLYGAGQDLLKDAFSGNIRGMGPGVAEMEFTKRGAETLIAFMMDKTDPGAFNMPIYRMFADPFNTIGLVIDPNMIKGFVFEIWDIRENKRVFLRTPEELHELLALIGARSRYVVKRVFPKEGGKLPADEPVAVISTEKLYLIAGEYVGKDDPVAIVRSQSGLPALGEVLEPFSFPHLVSGWMRGSHNGPVMPVAFENAKCTRFDGPPRVIAAGFQVTETKLVGPADLFDDPAWDYARQKSLESAEYIRRHGPFEPHRLPMEEMEYTTLPKILNQLKSRLEDIE
jgi:fructose 1,6-bisphosphate aldolase/phosphatase